MAKLFAYQQSVNGAVSFIQTDDATVDAQWGAASTNWQLEDGTPVIEIWRYANATLNGSSNGVATYSGTVDHLNNPNVQQQTVTGQQLGGGACAFTAGTARFAGPSGANAVDTTNTIATRMVMSKPWTLKSLYGKIDAAAGSSKSVTICVMKNGTDSVVTLTISGTTATTGNDLTHSVGGNAGDDICIHITSTAAGSAAIASWGFVIVQ